MDLPPPGSPLPCPACRNAFLGARCDHLGDVAAAQGDPLTRQLERTRLLFNFGGQGLEFLGADNERRQVEAKRVPGVPSPALPRVALAVRAVSADYQSGINQDREVPAQRRGRHAVCAYRKLLIGGKDDERLFPRQCRHIDRSCSRAIRASSTALGAARERSPRMSSNRAACKFQYARVWTCDRPAVRASAPPPSEPARSTSPSGHNASASKSIAPTPASCPKRNARSSSRPV